jgi:hypothetical protein
MSLTANKVLEKYPAMNLLIWISLARARYSAFSLVNARTAIRISDLFLTHVRTLALANLKPQGTSLNGCHAKAGGSIELFWCYSRPSNVDDT